MEAGEPTRADVLYICLRMIAEKALIALIRRRAKAGRNARSPDWNWR